MWQVLVVVMVVCPLLRLPGRCLLELRRVDLHQQVKSLLYCGSERTTSLSLLCVCVCVTCYSRGELCGSVDMLGIAQV